jgi:SAM-dependent methyltransferase
VNQTDQPKLPESETTLTYILDTYSDRERLYTQYELLRSDFNDWMDRALRLGGLSTDPETATWRAVDVGCGEGLFSAEIVNRYPRAYVLGFDKDAGAIATATQVFRGKSNMQFRVHDVLQLFPRQLIRGHRINKKGMRQEQVGFDLAVAHIVLLHIREPAEALANIHAALKPDGVIYLCDSPADRLTFPHPSLAALCTVMSEAVRLIATPDFADRQTEYLREAGFDQIVSGVQVHIVGGPTVEGQRRLLNLVSALRAARSGLVEGLRLMSGDDFDEHMRRIAREVTPDMVTSMETINTVARKRLDSGEKHQ